MFFLICIVILTSLISVNMSSDDFSTDYCPYLSLMSSNEDSIIYANMQTSKFYLTTQSNTNGSKCEIDFDEFSICGLSFGRKANSTKSWFIYWGYDDDQNEYYITTINYSIITSKKCLSNSTTKIYLSTNSPIFKTLENRYLAYGFDYHYFYLYDFQMNRIHRILPNNLTLKFTPSDMIISQTGDQIIALGYLQDVQEMFASICLWNINSMNLSIIIKDCQRLHSIGYHFSEYHPGPKLSVDLNGNLIAIGNSASRTIEMFMFNQTNLMKIHRFESNVETNSVSWLSDGHRIAVVAHLTPTPPWSQSQIQIYDFNVMFNPWPQYIFPNNQQQFDSWNYKNPSFILVSIWKQWNSLIIQMDTEKILVVLSSGPGSYPDPFLFSWFDNPWIWIGLRNRRLNEQSSTPCWPGMFKKQTNFLFCDICPPTMKSTSNAIECHSCNSSRFCPLASPDDLDVSSMIDIHHITSYPISSDVSNFEDILLTNMFSIEHSTHCIVISPLFWTLIVIFIIVIFLIIVGILKFFPESHKHRTMIKRIFRQTDVIGEGELWIGGLMSFSLFVLLIFAFLFSNEYSHLYPIEESFEPVMTCDRNLRNAKFDTRLKLLLATRTDEDEIIFDLLDNQPSTLTIQFLNTKFTCDQLSILQGTGENLHEPLNSLTCLENNSSEIIFTSIVCPHQVTFQYKINHFAPIGGLYICLTGPGNVSNDGWNTIRETQFCKWIGHDNQTIGYSPQIRLLNTKVINRTANFINSQPMKSSGIWQSMFIGSELSDENLYNRRGEYHRYLSTQTILTIILDENHFYVENNQSPIARQAEIHFHTILFVSVALEIFGLTFLIFKLLFVPLFRLVERRIVSHSRKISAI